MTEWQATTTSRLLDDGVLEIGDGYRAKNSEFVENGGLPFVRVGDIGTRIRLNGLDELPGTEAAKYGSKVSQPLDSLITMKGTVGRVAFVTAADRPFVYSPQISYWRSRDPRRLDPRWLRYWLESPEFLSQASATKGATDMADYINLRDQRRMRITLPPTDVQDQVAAVLASLDGLIENNASRVAMLQEMVGVIYQGWFVRYRYPGHENSTLYESEVGCIPTGWKSVRLGEIASVDKGLSYKGAYLTGTGVPMANLKCFRPAGGFRRDGAKLYSGVFKGKDEVRPGDLLVANTDLTQAGTIIGSPAFLPRAGFASGGIISHHVFAVRCSELETRFFLREVFRDRSFRSYARGVASGTTVLGLRPADLLNYKFVLPPSELLLRFGALASNAMRTAENLEEGAEVLRCLRAFLLPRLVTGQIEVSTLDLDALVESSSA